MIRKTAFTNLTGLAVLGLSISACTSAQESAGRGGEQAAVPVDPADESQEEAQLAVAEDTHGGGHGVEHGAVAHRGGHDQGGAGDNHGSGMGSHSHGNQRQESAERRLGEEVRDFAVTDNAGKAFRLRTLRATEKSRGKIAVLTFWCTTCSSCRRIEKDFDEKARGYEEQGVLFLTVDSNFTDSAQRVNQFLEESDLSFRVLMDPESEIARYFGARLTTTTAVIDAEGRLRYYGGFGGAEDAVRNLMAGEDVAVPESPGGG
jgi:peroxiredoxin